MRTFLPPLLLFLAILLQGCAPHKPDSPFVEAMKHRKQGEMTEYRRSLEREIRLHPNNLDARYNLALQLEGSGHQADARTLYRANLEHGRHFASAINLAQLLRRQGQRKEARALLRQTAGQFPHEATPWYLLAHLDEETGKNSRADEHYRKAIDADPHNGFARLYYATFLAKREKFDQAEQQGQLSVKRLPACAPCWRQLGDILRRSDKIDEAIAAYQRSLAILPNVDTRQRLIDALNASGRKERARRMQAALDAWRQSHPQVQSP